MVEGKAMSGTGTGEASTIDLGKTNSVGGNRAWWGDWVTVNTRLAKTSLHKTNTLQRGCIRSRGGFEQTRIHFLRRRVRGHTGDLPATQGNAALRNKAGGTTLRTYTGIYLYQTGFRTLNLITTLRKGANQCAFAHRICNYITSRAIRKYQSRKVA